MLFKILYSIVIIKIKNTNNIDMKVSITVVNYHYVLNRYCNQYIYYYNTKSVDTLYMLSEPCRNGECLDQ